MDAPHRPLQAAAAAAAVAAVGSAGCQPSQQIGCRFTSELRLGSVQQGGRAGRGAPPLEELEVLPAGETGGVTHSSALPFQCASSSRREAQ